MGSPDIDARLRRYVPRCMGRAAWDLAQEPVVTAILASEPTSQRSALDAISILCGFLAKQSSWDKTAAPDLAALLTKQAIATYTSSAGLPGAIPKSRRIYRRFLRSIAAAIGGIERTPPAFTNPIRNAVGVSAAFWPLASDLGPFAALVELYTCRGIAFHTLTWRSLRLENEDLSGLIGANSGSAIDVSASPTDRATLAGVRRSGAALRDVSVPSLVGSPPGGSAGAAGEQPTPSPTSSSFARPPKKLSRTAAAREARAAYAASQTSAGMANGGEAGPRARTAEDLQVLDSELTTAIANYLPLGIGAETWARIEGTTRLLVTASRPPSLDVLRNQASHLSRFAAWVATRPDRTERQRELAADEVLAHGLLDAYLAGPMAAAPDPSRGTARAVVRRALRGISTEIAPEPIGYVPVQPPYTQAECAAFVRLARNQPTPSLRRALSAMVGLGLGGGLDGKDQKGVTPQHITEVELTDGTFALATTVVGKRARTVIIAAQYEDLVREALELHAKQGRRPDQPLYGNSTSRTNATAPTREKAMTARGHGVDINVTRLRSTWLVAAMAAAVPLGALLHAAGLKSARTFADLLPYCPPADPDVLDQLLHDLDARGAVIPERSGTERVGR